MCAHVFIFPASFLALGTNVWERGTQTNKTVKIPKDKIIVVMKYMNLVLLLSLSTDQSYQPGMNPLPL